MKSVYIIIFVIIFLVVGIYLYNRENSDIPKNDNLFLKKDDIKSETNEMGDKSLFSSHKAVMPLQLKDFSGKNLSKNNTGLVLFYADWCPHCHQMVDVWSSLANSASFLDIMAMNCVEPSFKDSELAKDIGGFPTIVLYQNGKPVETFKGNRQDAGELLSSCLKICPGKNCKSR